MPHNQSPMEKYQTHILNIIRVWRSQANVDLQLQESHNYLFLFCIQWRRKQASIVHWKVLWETKNGSSMASLWKPFWKSCGFPLQSSSITHITLWGVGRCLVFIANSDLHCSEICIFNEFVCYSILYAMVKSVRAPLWKWNEIPIVIVLHLSIEFHDSHFELLVYVPM